MIAVGVFVVAAAVSITVAVLLTAFVFVFVRFAGATRRTLEGLVWSRWLTWLGVAIAVGGVVIGIWLEVTVPNFPSASGYEVQQRLNSAVEGFSMVGAGALLAVAAQIMGMMQATREQSSNSAAQPSSTRR